MVALMVVLQCLGGSALEACRFTASCCKETNITHALSDELGKTWPIVGATSGTRPPFLEIYSTCNILAAFHGSRRNLNIDALHTLNLCRANRNGQHWDVDLAADRAEARAWVESLKPTWFIGSPPRTAFSRPNIGLNYQIINPKLVQGKNLAVAQVANADSYGLRCTNCAGCAKVMSWPAVARTQCFNMVSHRRWNYTDGPTGH